MTYFKVSCVYVNSNLFKHLHISLSEVIMILLQHWRFETSNFFLRDYLTYQAIYKPDSSFQQFLCSSVNWRFTEAVTRRGFVKKLFCEIFFNKVTLFQPAIKFKRGFCVDLWTPTYKMVNPEESGGRESEKKI